MLYNAAHAPYILKGSGSLHFYSNFKGTVQQDLTGAENYFIRQVLLQGCPILLLFLIFLSRYLLRNIKPMSVILYRKRWRF